jgi:hypothetical protein
MARRSAEVFAWLKVDFLIFQSGTNRLSQTVHEDVRAKQRTSYNSCALSRTQLQTTNTNTSTGMSLSSLQLLIDNTQDPTEDEDNTTSQGPPSKKTGPPSVAGVVDDPSEKEPTPAAPRFTTWASGWGLQWKANKTTRRHARADEYATERGWGVAELRARRRERTEGRARHTHQSDRASETASRPSCS